VDSWIKKLLNSLVQSAVSSGICDNSSHRLVTICISQRSLLVFMIFNIFINDLDHRAECSLNKFLNDTEQRGEADAPDEWAERNFKQFTKGKCKVPYLGNNNPSHQHRLWANQLECSFAENDL